MKKGYHKTKSGKIAKKGLWFNVNRRKKKGISRSKAKSTISAKAYRISQNLRIGASINCKSDLIRGVAFAMWRGKNYLVSCFQMIIIIINVIRNIQET